MRRDRLSKGMYKCSKLKYSTSPNTPKYKISDFDNLYNKIISNLCIDDKLFYHSLKRNNISLIKYFELLSSHPSPNKRIIFFQSPSSNGLNFLISKLQSKFQCTSIPISLNKENTLSDFFTEISNQINNSIQQMHNNFLIIKNFPLELYNNVMFTKNYTNLYHDWIADFITFKNLLINHLNSPIAKSIIIFWWEDTSIDMYILDKTFEEKIIAHNNTEIITLKGVTATRIKSIVKDILSSYAKNELPAHCYDNIVTECKGNLVKLKNILINILKTQGYSKESNNIMEIDRDLFHLLGKILYNKRIDPLTKQIRPMKKIELSTKPSPELYYKIQDIIDYSPIAKEEFNNLLIEGAYSHIRNIEELTHATNSFSYSDTINKFKYRIIEKNYPIYDTIENMKFVLNANALIAYNYCQYDRNQNSFCSYKKSIYNYHIKANASLYYKCIERNPSVASISKKIYLREIDLLYQRIRVKKSNRDKILQSSNCSNRYYKGGNDELTDYDLDKIFNELKEVNNYVIDEESFRLKPSSTKFEEAIFGKENNNKFIQGELKVKIENKKLGAQEEYESLILSLQEENGGNCIEEEDPYDIVD